jgi:hypothetical protein
MNSPASLTTMTRPRIRHGVFRTNASQQAAINAYIAEHNASPKPVRLAARAS